MAEKNPPAPALPTRRAALKLLALSAAAALLAARHSRGAQPTKKNPPVSGAPENKNLPPVWLAARGEPQVYRGAELRWIGMPVGGVGCGTLYLGGDGRLWLWDIFNRKQEGVVAKTITWRGQPVRARDGANYVDPIAPFFPVAQGFALRVGDTTIPLSHAGFADLAFRGEYPIGTVDYRGAALPVSVRLEAFSPFIPLNTEDSSLPTTILRFTVKNDGEHAIEAALTGWLENAVGLHSAQPGELARRNLIAREKNSLVLCCAAEPQPPRAGDRPALVFADGSNKSFAGWSLPPGDKPSEVHVLRHRRSDPFTISHRFITAWLGGGDHNKPTTLRLLVAGATVQSTTADNFVARRLAVFDVAELAGKIVQLEFENAATAVPGNSGLGAIAFTDSPVGPDDIRRRPDFGTLALALLDSEASDTGDATAPGFENTTNPVGTLRRPLLIGAGQSATVTFVLAWHFPNLRLGLNDDAVGRHYAKRFDDAPAVAAYVAENFPRLDRETHLWRDTWYDSSLPWWFLDRTFANTSVLATSTAHRFATGRFYGWEGVGVCRGTCTHVWHYAQAVARIFPDLERDLRERTDYGSALDPKTGAIGFRGEFDQRPAVDGQAGVILRTLREHQMSADGAFLRRVWPQTKQALDFLIARDSDENGLLDGAQENTLDTAWFGQSPWLSSLYLAALRAGEEMARELDDDRYAHDLRVRIDTSQYTFERALWNGEYFIQTRDPLHPRAVGSYEGCHIDQVLGQAWAHQLGLGRILSEKKTRSALAALWKHNYFPDVGPFREAHPGGRPFALPGEAGLVMVTFPLTPEDHEKHWSAMYFNECMTGFEHFAAAHMLAEGLVTEGLTVTRAIHDRYAAAKRNPWNEIECSDHYARAMASYATFIAAGGFECNGPRGRIGFAPKISPENFRCAFTAAEGWGRFSQQLAGEKLHAQITVRWGRLRLTTVTLAPAAVPARVTVTLAGTDVPAAVTFAAGRAEIVLAEPLVVATGQTLEVVLS